MGAFGFSLGFGLPGLIRAAAAPPAPANMLVDPGFDDATKWILLNPSGASSIAGGKMHFRDEFQDGDELRQVVAALVNGTSYTVSGTISARTQGRLQVILGNTLLGTAAAANGPFSFTGAVDTGGGAKTLRFVSVSGGAMLDLDDVSCVPS